MTPSTPPTIARTCSSNEERSGQPATVSAIVTSTAPAVVDDHVAHHVELGHRPLELGVDHRSSAVRIASRSGSMS